MVGLSQRDWVRLQEAIVDLHSVDQPEEIPGRILDGLRRMVPCDSASLQDDLGGSANVPWLRGRDVEWRPALVNGPIGLRMMPPWAVDYLSFREAWLAVSAERHPHTDYFRHTGDGSARRLSDLISMRELRRTSFYNELSRPTRVDRQLTIYMPLSTGATLTVAACRRKLDFTDTECALLQLLRPHVQIAWNRLHRDKHKRNRRPNGAVQEEDGSDLLHLGITKREAEVLRWVAEGKTNPELCIILGLSLSTIKTHMARLFEKTGCENRTSLARVAFEATSRKTHD
jgi:DNA-binding CsgD family transcriptional regulator